MEKSELHTICKQQREVINFLLQFTFGIEVDEETLAKIHEKAHANCFIANSLACEVEIK